MSDMFARAARRAGARLARVIYVTVILPNICASAVI
jgi:hypothetical protein